MIFLSAVLNWIRNIQNAKYFLFILIPTRTKKAIWLIKGNKTKFTQIAKNKKTTNHWLTLCKWKKKCQNNMAEVTTDKIIEAVFLLDQ